MYVYIFDFGDQIKIGKTKDVDHRRNVLEKESGRKVVQQFSIETDGKYESLMHKMLNDYRGVGEYFTYPYKESVSLLQIFIKNKIVPDEKLKSDSFLLSMDYCDRIQILVKEKSIKENNDISLEAFLETLDIDYNDFFRDRKKKAKLLEDLAKIAQTLGISIEYLVTGNEPDVAPIIWQLESALEELKKL
ncbi:MAG: GIY-YIG nuclease family protein [Dysgonamonadaceae bacterium]|jgi:hypothetical protein|nr:GIY-YIG nuclease family protein [Dysgonamonadaceae bacterium]